MSFRIAFCIYLLLTAPVAAGDTWDSFQNGGSMPAGQQSQPPLEWGTNGSLAWSFRVDGYGQSSPVIWQDTVYLTYVSGDMKQVCHLVAVDRQSGKQRWAFQQQNPAPEKNTNYVSRSAPTPVCDAAGVVAFFEGGLIVAFDASGKRRWQRDLVEDYGPISARHGLAASLEQNEAHVFVWVERQQQPFLLALRKDTGETVWKAEGLGATSWSSPRMIPVGGAHHLVLSGIGKIVGIDPETGARLWSFDDISGNSTPTPVPVGDGRFLMGASSGRGQSAGGKAAESNGLIEIKQDNEGKFFAEFVWRAQRATTSFGSPIVAGSHAYFVNRSGVVYCLDVQTGEELYSKRSGESVWATPIALEDRIYLFGKDGKTTVIRTGPQYEAIAVNAKPEGGGGSVLYAGVIVGSDLLLRFGDVLHCFRAE